MNEYADAVEEAYRSHGWEPTFKKPELTMHLAWLARHDVGKESVKKISRKPERPDQVGWEGRTERQVRDAITKVRKLIDKEDRRQKSI